MVDMEAGEFQLKFELPSIKEVNKKILTEVIFFLTNDFE
jgi:hypothetical protein